jgi:carboxymethylenebutenolidase
VRVELTTGTPAELARPSGREASMGLVLWPDIWGLRPLFDEHARRLADDHGFSVCVPEIYPGDESLGPDERHAAAARFDDDAKLADSLAAADATGSDRVGIMGFCMGGMYALKAVGCGRFVRHVSFYGMARVPVGWAGPGQRDALDLMAEGDASSVLYLVGTQDPWCPEADVAALDDLGVNVVRYRGADHAFAQDPSRDTYRAADAADAWNRAVAFLLG